MDAARLVSFQGFTLGLLDFGLGQVIDATPTQQPVQRREAHRRLDELPYHGQQVVLRQPQMRVQIHDALPGRH